MTNEMVFNVAKLNVVKGDLDFDTADIRIALIGATAHASAYDPDNANLTACFATAVEASGTGYVRKDIASVTTQQDDTNDRSEILIGAQTWTGADFGETQGLLVYVHVDGTDANDLPISFHDDGFPVTTNGGDLTVNFAGAGNDEAIYLT